MLGETAQPGQEWQILAGAVSYEPIPKNDPTTFNPSNNENILFKLITLESDPDEGEDADQGRSPK